MEPVVRLRFEYRQMTEISPDGMRIVHAVYDTWHDQVRTKLGSKYQCKQYINRNQEEIELDGKAN